MKILLRVTNAHTNPLTYIELQLSGDFKRSGEIYLTIGSAEYTVNFSELVKAVEAFK